MSYQYRGAHRDPACGTLKGYSIHLTLKTPPCPACESAVDATIAAIRQAQYAAAMNARITRARIARGRQRPVFGLMEMAA